VILCSSEHAFPYRLQDSRLNFNLKNFRSFIFAGEVPPASMWELLTQKWEIDEQLAGALISRCGGHIFDLELCLDRLCNPNRPTDFWDKRNSGYVMDCLEWKGQGAGAAADTNQERMRTYLRMLAENGFVPLESRNDPIAEVISKNNVGGVVLGGCEGIGLPDDVWVRPTGGKSSFLLVPASQSMRLVIASML
jgi:hypothetical protein